MMMQSYEFHRMTGSSILTVGARSTKTRTESLDRESDPS